METIFDMMSDFFQQDGWNPKQIEDQPILRMGMAGKHGRWLCYAKARVALEHGREEGAG